MYHVSIILKGVILISPQERWFTRIDGISGDHIAVLKKLPIFRAGLLPDKAPPLPTFLKSLRPSPHNNEAGLPLKKSESTDPRFVDLDTQRYLAPAGFDRELQSRNFIECESQEESQVETP